MKRTTDLNRVRRGEPFTWGEVIRIHEIGHDNVYSVVEYHPWKSLSHVDKTPDPDVVLFHYYVNGVDTNHLTDTLEAAIVGAIAYAFEGPNHHADKYFMKGISKE